MSYKFPKSLSGLKSVSSDYINNSYDFFNEGNVIIQGNLNVSGTFSSPLTSLLGVSVNQLNDKTESYYLTTTNAINLLGTSHENTTINLNNINTDLQSSKNLISTSFIDTRNSINNLSSLISVSCVDLRNTDTLLQSQIDNLATLGISGQNVDTQIAVSCAVFDTKLGLIIGTTLPILGVSCANMDYTNYLQGGYITTLENLGISHENRLDVAESNIFNLGVTSGLHEIRLDDIDTLNITFNERITDLEGFCYGTTMSYGTTGVEWTESAADSLQDIITYVQYGIDGINAIQWSYQAYQAIQNTSFSAFIASQTGYNTLNDTTNTTQNTAIGVNSVGLAVAVADIAALNVASALLSVSSSVMDSKIYTLFNNDTTLGTSIAILDSFKNSFSLGTTTHLASLDSSITNIGTTLNTQSTRITNYENRIDLTNPLNIKFKGATINGMELSDTELGVTANGLFRNNLTISGTLQSPLTSLLGVSLGVIDLYKGTMLSTSMPQYLTRNETILPSSFITSSLRKLGTSCVVGNNQVVDVNLPNVSFQASNYPNDTNVVITSQEGKKSSLYFGTPFDNGTNTSNKTAIIVEGQTFGRGTMNFCFNRNTSGASHVNSNTTINDKLMSINHDGSIGMTGTLNVTGAMYVNDYASRIWLNPLANGDGHMNTTNRLALYSNGGIIGAVLNSGTLTLNNLNVTGSQINSGNFTVSGVLQSPLTSLLGVSVNNCLTKTGTQTISGVNGSIVINNTTSSNPQLRFSTTDNLDVGIEIGGSLRSYIYSYGTRPLVFAANGTERVRVHSSGNVSINNTDDTHGLKVTGTGLFTSDLTVSGVLQSPLTSLLGVSVGILDTKVYNLGISSSNMDARINTLAGVSGVNYLTRNETILPSSFINSSLTNIGSTGINGIMINTSDWATINAPSVNSLLTFRNGFTTGDSSYVGMVNDEFEINNSVGSIIIKPNGVSKWTIDTSGNVLQTNNLTISGVLQSPLTSLLGVSVGILDGFRTSMVGTSMPQYLTRNETILPSSFTSSSLTSLGQLGSLDFVDVSQEKLSLFGTNNSGYGIGITNSTTLIYADAGHDVSLGYGGYTSYTEVLRTKGSDNSTNVRNFNVLNNQVNTGNLTVSGVLQCSTSSLLGASTIRFPNTITDKIVMYQDAAGNIGLGVTNGKLVVHTNNTSTDVSIGNNSNGSAFTGYNEKLLVANTQTSIYNTLLCTSNAVVNSQSESVNSYLYLSNSNGAGNALKTLIMSEAQSSFSRGKLHFCLNNDGTSNSVSQSASLTHSLMSLDYNGLLTTTGNILARSNLTISGTLQSPLTSLLGVSVGNLTTNSSVISDTNWGTNSNGKTIKLADSVIFDGSTGSNCYLQFKDSGTSTNGLFGLVGDNLIARISDSASFKVQSTAASDIMTINNSGNMVVSGSLTSGALSASTGNFSSSLTSSYLVTDSRVYNPSGNASFKIQSSAYTYRYETQDDDEHYLWDGANNEVYHVSGDNQIWFQSDVNCAGTYFDSGVPLVPSSKLIKEEIKNMREIEDKPTILDKIDFKHYKKNYKGKEYDEVGILIEDLESIEGIDIYNLIHTREMKGKNTEYDGLKYLKYVPFFMTLFSELKEENRIIKEKLNDMIENNNNNK